jgi:hypothetical protein
MCHICSGRLSEFPNRVIHDLNIDLAITSYSTNSHVPPSPPQSPILGQLAMIEHFSPTLSDLSDADSVVLSVNSMTPYLDKALAALGLHTEARTSFIT